MKTFFAFTITILLCLALISAALGKDCKPKDTNCEKYDPVCGRGKLRHCYWFKNLCEMEKEVCNYGVDLEKVDIGQCRRNVTSPCKTE